MGLEKHENNETWEQLLQEMLQKVEEEKNYDSAHWQALIRKITRQQVKVVPIRRERWFRVAVAATIIFIFGIAAYLSFYNRDVKEVAIAPTPQQQEIPPGHEGAILTLSDGRQLILDTLKGMIAKEGGVTVRNNNGSIIYDQQSALENTPVLYNTISTPKGRQYQLILEDGTNVWLNAASSVRFPTEFTGNDRRVEISGEVYFEVKRNSGKPFIVSVNDMNVKVLGTSFNVNAYADEDAVRTTLLEGKVQVTRDGSAVMLLPGQQAVADPTAGISVATGLNLDVVMAWRNGIFYFTNASITTIMRQIQRWYDVEVVYPSGVPKDTYSGKISRYVNASHVLKALQEGGLNFRIEGRKVIVLK